MHVGETIHPKGCFTQLKYIAGQSLSEVERRLGYRTGRLAKGAYVVQASELPGINDFNLLAYSQIPADRFKTEGKYDLQKANAMFPGTSETKKLRQIVLSSWQQSGPDSLVKIIPVTPHSDRETYPSGSGVPQWELTVPLRCRVAAFVEPNQHVTVR
ncbi:hypothetical protein [Sabulibacter ruber]|uniref:hypothetical protein n=1 Tax=Sabulibacter ruber TaxID=2811901 RepID=UPI001A96FD64|nr:hypothetical protein [Sabulibacter ruber]